MGALAGGQGSSAFLHAERRITFLGVDQHLPFPAETPTRGPLLRRCNLART